MAEKKIDFKYENLHIGIPVTILSTALIFVALVVVWEKLGIIGGTTLFITLGTLTAISLHFLLYHRFIELDGTAVIYRNRVDFLFKYSEMSIRFKDIADVRYAGNRVEITLKDSDKKLRIWAPVKYHSVSNLYVLYQTLRDKIEA